MSFRPDRGRKPGRRTPSREPRRRILVVCEGEKTEPQYIEGFARAHRDSIVDVKIAGGVGVPRTVVQEAKRRKIDAEEASKRDRDPFQKWDAVWCALDVDEHPQLREALDMAKANGIQVAMSNPCIELWLLLHHLNHAPGMLDRDKARSKLKKFIPGYDKTVDFEKDYRQGYEQAVRLAEKLDALAESVGEVGRNPTTSFYRLTQSIAASSTS